MKRKVALLLACLLLAAPLCAAEEAPLTGAWVLESVSMEASLEDGSLAFAYDIAEGGGEVELTLEPDGSAHVSVTEGLLDAASLSYLHGLGGGRRVVGDGWGERPRHRALRRCADAHARGRRPLRPAAGRDTALRAPGGGRSRGHPHGRDA